LKPTTQHDQLAFKTRNTKRKIKTWKFFSFHPFFAINLIKTSLSISPIVPSSQVFISSNAANRTFQLVSAKPVATSAGMRSAASDSASSGVCLYLNVSSAPGAVAAAGFPDLLVGGSFLTGGGATAAAAGASPAATAGFLAYAKQ
jgi:hypothetical protein